MDAKRTEGNPTADRGIRKHTDGKREKKKGRQQWHHQFMRASVSSSRSCCRCSGPQHGPRPSKLTFATSASNVVSRFAFAVAVFLSDCDIGSSMQHPSILPAVLGQRRLEVG